MSEPKLVTRYGWKARRSVDDTTDDGHSHGIAWYAIDPGDNEPTLAVRHLQHAHMDDEDQGDIRYNWVVDGQGRLYEARGWHCRNGIGDDPSTRSVAVLCNGHLTTASKRTMAWLARDHLRTFTEVRHYAPDFGAVRDFVLTGLSLGPDEADPEPPDPATDFTFEENLLDKLPDLKQGDSGVFVRRLQALLGVAGSVVTINGNFGPETGDAIDKFRKGRNIGGPPGTVDRKLWEVLVTEGDH